MLASAVLLALAALPSALAVPLGIQPPKFFNCPISVRPSIPSNQTQLVVDPSLKVQFVGLGVGTQNYTCTDAGTYTSAGALATLYDVSCVVNTSLFEQLPDIAVSHGGGPAGLTAAQSSIAGRLGGSPLVLGKHYFVSNAAGGISPKFDFTSSQKKSAFVVAAKKGNIPSPEGPADIDWLQLNKVDGTIGTQVFRIDTRAGQPPASCTPGSPLITKSYSAIYWFLG